MLTNKARAEWARQFVEFPPYDAHDDIEDAVVDLITDLLHLAHTSGMDVNRVLEKARLHFETEV